MFEFIKCLLLGALIIFAIKFDDYPSSRLSKLHLTLVEFSILLNTLLIIGAVLLFALILYVSGNFPQAISDLMTVIIVVEFVYMSFLHGKMIRKYVVRKKTLPKPIIKKIIKKTIKID